jgi:hypothetical protein
MYWFPSYYVHISSTIAHYNFFAYFVKIINIKRFKMFMINIKWHRAIY